MTAKNVYKSRKKTGKKSLKKIARFLGIDSSISEVIHVKFLPQIIFTVFLCVLYIWNSHFLEKQVRDIDRLETKVEDLRADYTTLRADYMLQIKQSEVSKRAKKIGLSQSKEPPQIIRP